MTKVDIKEATLSEWIFNINSIKDYFKAHKVILEYILLDFKKVEELLDGLKRSITTPYKQRKGKQEIILMEMDNNDGCINLDIVYDIIDLEAKKKGDKK